MATRSLRGFTFWKGGSPAPGPLPPPPLQDVGVESAGAVAGASSQRPRTGRWGAPRGAGQPPGSSGCRDISHDHCEQS